MLLLFQLDAIGLAFLAPRGQPSPVVAKKASSAGIAGAWPSDAKAAQMSGKSTGTTGSRPIPVSKADRGSELPHSMEAD